ncbi:hypothetical protein CYMTET_18317 [Cymbomonas tetramitiformis]|uniref:Uncharacterized protein n=1 Tax=Cymbomonas tetramitiformis TaxID=36881 RepID=A0AAE0G9N9_9CHLO|nr:hypothetical protein CYMTET_18317 [Cymbomonas tetramitiformis]
MDLFKGRLQASEGSYHKKEQENQIKDLQKKLIKEGKISKDLLSRLTEMEKRGTLYTADTLPEVLPEILQQSTRLSAPEIAELIRARKLMPTITGSKKSVKPFFGENAMGHVPAVRMGRHRWVPPEDTAALIPEEAIALKARAEAAQQAFRASTRALFYGSALSIVGLVVAVRCTISYLEIKSVEDLRNVIQRTASPLADGVRSLLAPTVNNLKEQWQSGEQGANETRANTDEFTQHLRSSVMRRK